MRLGGLWFRGFPFVDVWILLVELDGNSVLLSCLMIALVYLFCRFTSSTSPLQPERYPCLIRSHARPSSTSQRIPCDTQFHNVSCRNA
jgi:hypothetical protein